MITLITYGTGLWSWAPCMLFIREFTLGECVQNFGAIFLHYFGYINEDGRNDSIYRQGTVTMKRLFNTDPDWAWYDGPDSTTATVKAYWMDPTLGGGSLLGPL
jgi:hypothetical protein